MSNYLSYRWPGLEPDLPPVKPPRRIPSVVKLILITVFVLAIAAGLFLGGSFLAAYLLELTIPTQNTDAPQLPSSSQSLWEPDTQDTANTLPLTQPNPDMTVSLSEDADLVELSAKQIYEQTLASVVSVSAPHGNEGISVGSGVILSEDGYIVTNYHVIEGGDSISISMLSNQDVYEAKLVSYDVELDLAVIKIDATGLTPAQLADSDQLRVGDVVYAIGNPMGYLSGTMTDGIVSSPTRSIQIGGREMYLFQTSAALNSGNSGGALMNIYGQLVGITSAKITGMDNGTIIEGLGLVIPITDSLPFLNHMIQTGTSFRPSLGILCYEMTQDAVSGVYVKETTPDTPASEVLWPGDFIVSANGKETPSIYALTRVLNDTGVGNPVSLHIVRNGTELEVSVVLYDRLTEE